MKRRMWLLVVLVGVASMGLNAQAKPAKTNNPPANSSAGSTDKAVSCTLPKDPQAPGKEVSLTCTDVPSDATVKVLVKGTKDRSPATLTGKVQDNTVRFTPAGAGTYSVSVNVNSATPIDVPGQLEVGTPSSITCRTSPDSAPGTLPDVAPGQEVKLTCDDVSSGAVSLGGEDPKVGRVATDGTLTFVVPKGTNPGQYSLFVDKKPTQGQLNVMEPVEITGIYPGTTYQGQKGFDFNIAGKNFSTAPSGNSIEIVGAGTVRECDPEIPAAKQYPCAKIDSTTTNEIKVEGFTPKHYYGPVTVVVHVGKSASKPMTVTFAQLSQPGVVLAAAAVFFIVAYMLYRLVTKGVKGEIINGVQLTPWSSLFLDRETNSYSLSKFQVIAWTAVTVYSYVYIFLCRTLIQGNFAFPDVPQNLPQLFFVSAGTTVAAAAITASVGSKGAGPIQPSPADFISTGGLVAGDRFQFFTWTIVGCIGYVYLVIRMNPEMANISLPNVPDNFLYLMGVSSAGYLGGKLVRKPGPVIKALSVTTIATDPTKGTTLTMNLKGENLDPKAQVKVDNTPLRGDMFQITPPREPDPQTHFCDELNVSLYGADNYIDGTHELGLVNRDGQAATVGFPADPMSIDPIAAVTAETTAEITATGKSFADKTTFEWRNPADAKDPSDQGVAIYKSAAADKNASDKGAATLTVKFTTGPVGLGKLTLVSPIKLRATADVAVTQAGPTPTIPSSAGTQTGPTPSAANVNATTPAAAAMSVDANQSFAAGTDLADVTVTGTNFVNGITFEWRNPAGAQQANDAGPVTFNSATQLTVQLKPGSPSAGKLTLSSPAGQVIETNVTVT